MKKFLYMTQTEGALPKAYEVCYYPNSTWTTGRNRLIEEVKKQEKDTYLYYILLDDDLIFETGSFRKFERMLLKYRPAIGIPQCWGHNETFQNLEMEAHTVYKFDAAFNAFHKDVFFDDILFPYIIDFDDKLWWHSQLLLIHIANQFYDILQFNNIQVINEGHHHYPRGTEYFRAIENWLLETQLTDKTHLLSLCPPLRYGNLTGHVDKHAPASKVKAKVPLSPLDSYKISLERKKEIFKLYGNRGHLKFCENQQRLPKQNDTLRDCAFRFFDRLKKLMYF